MKSKIKKLVKKAIPTRLFYYWKFYKAFKHYRNDIGRLAQYSSSYIDSNKIEKLKTSLSINYHIIEKGLTMPETRLGFGQPIVGKLISACETYRKIGYDTDSYEYAQTIEVLREYLTLHEKMSFEIPKTLKEALVGLLEINKGVFGIQQMKMTSEVYFRKKDSSFDAFCRTRHSVRNYNQKHIPIDTIKECVNTARYSPSFCNRQPSFVYIANEGILKEKMLGLQNGNRGFGHLADTLLLITSDLTKVISPNERNEPFINSGLFSMTLLFALHENAIGTCVLNWSASDANDNAMRQLLGIPESQAIVMMIACGYPADELKLTASPRKPLNEIIFVK
jgi:nitroreductase